MSVRETARRVRTVVLLAATLCCAIHSEAQLATPDLAFETVSIRPLPAGTQVFPPLRLRPGGRVDGRATLEQMVRIAYELESHERVIMERDASVALAQAFEVVAKPPTDGTPPTALQSVAMMRRMLTDRFKMQVRTDSVVQTASVLRRLKPTDTGPGLRPFSGDCESLAGVARLDDPRFDDVVRRSCTLTIIGGHVRGTSEGVAGLANLLSSLGRRAIVDDTGLTGRVQIDLVFSPDTLMAGRSDVRAEAFATSAPSLIDALRDQLGLTMRTEQHPVRVLVIEHVEPLIEN